MKKTLATLFVMIICCSVYSQDFSTMTGDWMRVKAEYSDGVAVPNNHNSRIIVRYHFTKKEVYQVLSENTLPSSYTRTGNVLKIAPAQVFSIEQYNDKTLTLVETESPDPIRYYLIPTDSFQRSGRIKYSYEVINGDTIYSARPGIEPLYPKGRNEFMNSIMAGFTQTVSFNFTYVVRKDGTIGDVTIKASTNPKLDKRLIQLVKKSSGKWIPTMYKRKPIHVLMTESIRLNGGL